VLGVESVGPGAGFFDMGGHSLLAMSIVTGVREAFGVALPIQSLFLHPTLAGLAEEIDRVRGEGARAEEDDLFAVPRGAYRVNVLTEV
jgi:acyl carrier protein